MDTFIARVVVVALGSLGIGVHCPNRIQLGVAVRCPAIGTPSAVLEMSQGSAL